MSDDGCCGDTGGCCDDTGGGGWCDDSAPCMDSGPCETITTYEETSFSNGADVCFGQPYDEGYCCEDTTYQPVYSSLSTANNNAYITDPCGRAVIIITVIVATLILCKLNKSVSMRFLHGITFQFTLFFFRVLCFPEDE